MSLIIANNKGLYCETGDFYIDPWGKVSTAVITHAHSDHLRPGSKHYICSKRSERLVRHRLPKNENYKLSSYEFGEHFTLGEVSVSFHPAGHILGSAQIRLEYKGEVTVLTGDFKLQSDASCQPFQTLEADTLICEATFGLPIYRWEPSEMVINQIFDWWQRNAEAGLTSVVFGYSLGKTQRILSELSKLTSRMVFIHGALEATNDIYRNEGIPLLPTELVVDQDRGKKYDEDLILAPPGAFKSKWMNRFKDHRSAFISGWMRVRGRRRMGGYDTGFVLSDHADWSGLLSAIRRSGATEVSVGFTKSPVFVRYLREELGYNAQQLQIQYSSTDD